MLAHNEERSIKDNIIKINKILKKKINFSYLICEDGSTDNTLKVIKKIKKKINIILLTKKFKQGYSKAVMSGMRKSSADYLLIMDSDGQSNPDEVSNFWNNRKKANLIIGNRASRNDYMYRKFYSRIAFLIYKILFNLPIKDPSYAFVLVEKKVYENLSSFKPQMPDGFFWEFNARASKKAFDFFNLDVVHKKRIFGETRIYHWKNLPQVSFNNFIGMIKVKFFS